MGLLNMSGEFIGNFVGITPVANDTIQSLFGAIFLIMIAISFFMYYQIYSKVQKCDITKIKKGNLPSVISSIKEVVVHLLAINVVANLIFLIVVFLFKFIREGRVVFLPIHGLMMCLALSIALLLVVCKTCVMVTLKCESLGKKEKD